MLARLLPIKSSGFDWLVFGFILQMCRQRRTELLIPGPMMLVITPILTYLSNYPTPQKKLWLAVNIGKLSGRHVIQKLMWQHRLDTDMRSHHRVVLSLCPYVDPVLQYSKAVGQNHTALASNLRQFDHCKILLSDSKQSDWSIIMS